MMPSRPSLLLTLLLTSLALATPISKCWTCGGEAPAFSCESQVGCKDETAWGICVTDTGLTACGDPLPSQTQPLSACQKAAFDACDEFMRFLREVSMNDAKAN
ncbi:hypothetical protein GQ43DRAFT_493198 [Delitschia confertaspora ATCC 74209]|uniref:Uncharacterized protein n=1 Tax=Delitschia confertaspora ATCC 74209 TaxID=1513339 RepID=A0A9P4JG64_9PLEO|nr:hypothetical protein GQ43DRAFT_493198 [Delitschia confertaspora ATCC 74209]